MCLNRNTLEIFTSDESIIDDSITNFSKLLTFHVGQSSSRRIYAAWHTYYFKVVDEKTIFPVKYEEKQGNNNDFEILANIKPWKSNPIFTKAISYYYKGLELRDNPSSSVLYSEMYLQFYKAIEIILGHSKNLRKLKNKAIPIGLTIDYIKENIIPIYKKRDDKDIAHASTKNNSLTDDEIERAREIAHKIVAAYAQYFHSYLKT